MRNDWFNFHVGIVRTNALASQAGHTSSSGSGQQSDGDGSTSDSQSSIIHVVGPYRGPLLKNKNSTTSDVEDDKETNSKKCDSENVAMRPTSPNPQTSVWSPFG